MAASSGSVLVRGGTVVDGTGAPARRADVAIRDGRVTEVAARLGRDPEAEVLDATGCIVTPGFVDPHTHLDAQLAWDPSGSPSNLHGVTTVVLGLCGFGVAPAPPEGGAYLLRSLEAVEEIPFESTVRGVEFSWGTWGEWFDQLEARPLGVHVAGFVPHSALRFAVMGERARVEVAGESDRAALVANLRAALDAGAVGFATSRGPNHVDAYGDPVPSRLADDAELEALVAACAGRVWQINVATKFGGDAGALLAEVDRYATWTETAGARLTWTPFHAEPDGCWPEVLEHNAGLAARGLPVRPQVAAQPITVVFTFDDFSYVAFVPGWGDVFGGFFDRTPAERLDLLAAPATRDRLRSVTPDPDAMFAPCLDRWIVVASPTRPDLVGRNLVEAAGGADPIDAWCDLVVADELGTRIQVPAVNRSAVGVDALVADPHTLVGLGDAGAHVTSITNFSYPTHLLASFVRDRQVLPLEDAIARLTSSPARFLGLADRGTVVPGAPADLAVVDLDRLALEPVRRVADLPGGASRLVQGARGYRAVLVEGVRTVADDEPTGAGPGRVLRVG